MKTFTENFPHYMAVRSGEFADQWIRERRSILLQLAIPVVCCFVLCAFVHGYMDRHWTRLSLEFADLPVDHPVRRALNIAKLDLASIEPRLVMFGVQTTFKKLTLTVAFITFLIFVLSPAATT